MRATAVYRFYDAEDRLLYVGITAHLGVRFGTHERTAHWWKSQHRVTVTWRDTRVEAADEERAAIRNESPLFNVSGTRPVRDRVRRSRPSPEVRMAIATEVRVAIARAGKKKSEIREALGLGFQPMRERMFGETAFQDEELQVIADLLGVAVTDFLPETAEVSAA